MLGVSRPAGGGGGRRCWLGSSPGACCDCTGRSWLPGTQHLLILLLLLLLPMMLPCYQAAGLPAATLQQCWLQAGEASQQQPEAGCLLAIAGNTSERLCNEMLQQLGIAMWRCHAGRGSCAADLVHGAQHATLLLHDVLPAAVTEPAQHAVLDTLQFKEDPVVRSML